jgi:hypothetical protein
MAADTRDLREDSMSAEVIPFSAAARARKQAASRALTLGQRRREGKSELPPPATETAKNSRIRADRRDDWRHACRVSDYWRARLKWNQALGTAQHWEIANSLSLPPAQDENRFNLVDIWREAVARQLLTPAPDAKEVAWKRAMLAGNEFKHLPTKAERVEQMIAEDVAFLAAHPTRRSNSEAMKLNREFKEAMRQRIREVAALRNLPDIEIKQVLRLKHEEVVRWSKAHSVNISWLLEGLGPVFKPWPVS